MSSSRRTRLAAAVIATAIGSAALSLVVAAPALATNAPTTIVLSLNQTIVHTGNILQATSNVSITDGTPPAGTLTVTLDTTGGQKQESSQHISGAGSYATNITDFPLGPFTVTATFKPDSAIQQGSANASKTANGHGSSNLVLSSTKLTAGQSAKITANITTSDDVPSFDGSVRLDLGTVTGIATCTPQRTAPKTGSCTLSIPAQSAGTLPSNAVFTSPYFDDANSTQTFTVSAAAPSKSGGSGGSGGSGSSGASTSASASAVPLATETAAPQSSDSATAVAVKPTSSDSGVPVPLIVGIVILVLLLAAAAVFLILRARRKATAS